MRRGLLSCTLAATGLLLLPADASAAVRMAVCVDGFPGESILPGFEDCSDVAEVSHGFARTVDATGRLTSNGLCAPVIINKVVDGSSAGFLQRAKTGNQVPEVQILIDRAGLAGAPERAVEITLTNARVIAVRQLFDDQPAPPGSGPTAGKDLEEIELIPQTIEWDYTPSGGPVQLSCTRTTK